MSKKVFVVIQMREAGVYDIQGVFTSEKRARDACRGEMYGYGPITVNEEIPHEPVEWSGFVYPHLEQRP